MNNWYVITGGPSTGKSTLLAELTKLGHKTLPEAARVIINKSVAEGKSVDEIRLDEKKFQHKVLDYKIEIERDHPKELLTFFDRGMHDTLAYLKLNKFEIENKVIKAVKRSKYKKVFLLDPLDSYETDYARIETKAESIKLNTLLRDIFSEYGMVPIPVPAVSPSDRAEFVLRHIDEPTKI